MAKNTAIFFSLFLFGPLLFADPIKRFHISIKDLFKLNQYESRIEPVNTAPTFLQRETNSLQLITILGKANNQPIILNQTNRFTIKLPKLTDQPWLSNLKDSLIINQRHFTRLEEDILLKNRLMSLDKPNDSDVKEIGFLKTQKQTSNLVLTQVLNLRVINGPRSILNFDGNELIYFDLNKSLDPYSQINFPEQVNFNKTVPLFENKGKVLLSKSIRNMVMENAINRTGIVEANYISIKDNFILLENKDLGITRFSQRKNYLKQTIKAIKQRTKAQASDNLLNIKWKPRITKTSNWY